MEEYEGIHVECDEDNEITDVEVWRSYDDYLVGDHDAVLGYLERDFWRDGTPYFQTRRGFPLLALRAYLDGINFSVSLSCIKVDDYLTDEGLRISGQEQLFVPIVTEENLYAFVERCIEFEMLS